MSRLNSVYTRLPARERAFIDEYLIDQDPYRAAISCGYTHEQARDAKRWISRLPFPDRQMSMHPDREITNPRVRKALEEQFAAKARRAAKTADACVDELKKIAFANIADFLEEADDGRMIIDLSGRSRDELAALGEIITETKVEETDDGTVTTTKTKIKLWNKLDALTNLMKYFAYDIPDTSDRTAFEFTLNIGENTVNREGKVIDASADENSLAVATMPPAADQ